MVRLLDAPRFQLSASSGNGWPHNALRYHWLMPISCHFRDCKALLVTSLTHVSRAITSVQTFTFTFISFDTVTYPRWKVSSRTEAAAKHCQAERSEEEDDRQEEDVRHVLTVAAVAFQLPVAVKAVVWQHTASTDEHLVL